MEDDKIEICIVAERELFDDNHIDNLEKLGKVIFLRKNSFKEFLIKDSNKKIIVYDPDFGGWDFKDEILEKSKNILAVFLGTTDKSYINLELCNKLDISVYNIPKYAGDSVAEYLVMYMFSCAKKLPLQIKNENRQVFDDVFLQMQLKNKKVGIVGLGNIGSKIADICDGIGMKVCYWNKKIKQSDYEYISLKTLFKTCDVIYLCLQINDETKKIITDDLLKSMKKNTIFISCTGKQLFNYKIIENKINNQELFGYAIEEPDITIDTYKGNVMVTSEYGWFTKEASKQRIQKWYISIVSYLCDLYGYSSSKFIDSISIKENKNLICNIRKAKIEDIPAIAKLYMDQNWFGEENSIQTMKDNYDENSENTLVLVAEYKGKIVGTVTININKSLAFNCMKYLTFDYLVVKRDYRRRKVGTQLMEALFSIIEKENMESIWGVASYGRKQVGNFFKKVGLDDPVYGYRRIYLDESVVL